jgi:hypothetical protein
MLLFIAVTATLGFTVFPEADMLACAEEVFAQRTIGGRGGVSSPVEANADIGVAILPMSNAATRILVIFFNFDIIILLLMYFLDFIYLTHQKQNRDKNYMNLRKMAFCIKNINYNCFICQ